MCINEEKKKVQRNEILMYNILRDYFGTHFTFHQFKKKENENIFKQKTNNKILRNESTSNKFPNETSFSIC